MSKYTVIDKASGEKINVDSIDVKKHLHVAGKEFDVNGVHKEFLKTATKK